MNADDIKLSGELNVIDIVEHLPQLFLSINGAKRKHSNAAKPSTETDRPLAPLCWAERLKRVFKIDIELCPKCGGRLRVIAAITEPNAIQKILDPGSRPAVYTVPSPLRSNSTGGLIQNVVLVLKPCELPDS